MPDRRGPLRNSRFLVEIDGIAISGFERVDLPSNETRQGEYREGNEPPRNRKLWGTTEYADLVLERGVDADGTTLFDWRKEVTDGKVDEARSAVAVQLLDEEGQSQARWQFSQAWPKRYEPPTLDANGGGTTATETLVVAYSEMERTQ